MANGTTDYKLGQLDSSVKSLHNEFTDFRQTILNRMKNQEKKIDSLRMWKVRTVGITAGISSIISAIIVIIGVYLKFK